MFTNGHKPTHVFAALALLMLALVLSIGPGMSSAWAATSVGSNTTYSVGAQQADSKVTSQLRQKFGNNPNAIVRYLVMLTQQADTSNKLVGKVAKAQYVYDTLKKLAASTQ